MPKYPSEAKGGIIMPPKNAAAVVDYTVDLDDGYLQSTEIVSSVPSPPTITGSATMAVDSNPIVASPKTGRAATAIRVWLSGGAEGDTALVDVPFVTDGGRTDSRRMVIEVARV